MKKDEKKIITIFTLLLLCQCTLSAQEQVTESEAIAAAIKELGREVGDTPHTGLTATLDVSRWPAGTYILRLHTPAGTVGKKLIVRR